VPLVRDDELEQDSSEHVGPRQEVDEDTRFVASDLQMIHNAVRTGR